MAVFITLVHGTFARRAKWIQPDSALSKYLASNIPEAVQVEPFRWSGQNSVSARLKAAGRLRVRLLDRLRERPDDRHFVIAHSHGGAVAAYAIQENQQLNDRIGLVCLSTPFLQLELKGLSRSARGKLNSFRLCLFILLVVAVSQMINGERAALAGWIGACIGSLGLLWLTSRSSLARGQERSRNFIAKANIRGLRRDRVLLARSDADEASLILALAQSVTLGLDFLSSFVGRYLTPPGWILNSILTIWFGLAGSVWLFSIFDPVGAKEFEELLNFLSPIWMMESLPEWILNLPGGPWFELLGGLTIRTVIIVVPFVLVVLPVLMALLPVAVAAITALAAGADVLLYQPFLRSSVETSPAGNWSCHLFALGERPLKSLRHSRSWEDPEVFRAVADWIATRNPSAAAENEPPVQPGNEASRSRRRWNRSEIAAVIILALCIFANVRLHQYRIYDRKLSSVVAVTGTPDGRSLWAIGNGGTTLYSRDGSDWHVERSATGYTLRAIAATSDGSNVWAVGDSGRIVRSVKGEAWTLQRRGTETLQAVFADDRGHAWAVGNRGTILRTFDGEHWTTVASPTTADLLSISGARQGGPLWIGGNDGAILRSENGESWKSVYRMPGGAVNALFVTRDGRTVWAVGQDGWVVNSRNGKAWTDATQLREGVHTPEKIDLTDATSAEFFSVFATDDGMTVWAVGIAGTIAHTSDGTSWKVEHIDGAGNPVGWLWVNTNTNPLTSIFATSDGSSLWIAGQGQRVLVGNRDCVWRVYP